MQVTTTTITTTITDTIADTDTTTTTTTTTVTGASLAHFDTDGVSQTDIEDLQLLCSLVSSPAPPRDDVAHMIDIYSNRTDTLMWPILVCHWRGLYDERC